MTPLQKVIKYGAIAFGFYLVFVILSAIIFGVTAIFGISVGINTYRSYTTQEDTLISSFEEEFEGVNNLNIKLDVSKLTIKNGDEFRIEVQNPTNNFYCKMDGETLKIRDDRTNINLFNFTDDVIPEITLYIPENQKFTSIEIETGISETYIENLVAEEIDIEAGVGKFTIAYIDAKVANISGGAGETTIGKSVFDTLKLEAGVGKFVINSEVLEEAEIEAGVGQLIVNLEGNKKNYKIKTNTGLGNLLVDGKKSEDNQITGEGNSYIKVEAGVGEVNVNFLENSI